MGYSILVYTTNQLLNLVWDSIALEIPKYWQQTEVARKLKANDKILIFKSSSNGFLISPIISSSDFDMALYQACRFIFIPVLLAKKSQKSARFENR